MSFRFGKPNVAKLRKKRDIEGLITALRYKKDERVREGAAEALGNNGDARAVEPLINALNGEYDIRRAAAGALGKIGDSGAVEPLIKALSDTNEYVRKEAAEALGEIQVSATHR